MVANDEQDGRSRAFDDETTAALSDRVIDEDDILRKGTSFGRYVILHAVGAGGMGVVYAAYDPELDRRVAIKILHPETADVAAQQRLLREAQAMARLAHPNVVTVHDVGTVDEQAFVTMEFVKGSDLRTWLKENAPDPQRILEVFIAAGQGLAAAHAVGLVHRDFKAGNVLVGKDGRVRVTDFGLACAADLPVAEDTGRHVRLELSEKEPSQSAFSTPITVAGELLGTPGYMAPELFDGHKADERTDQYAFCVALYRALYKVHPFGHGTILEQLHRAETGRVETPTASPSVPARVRRTLLRGLSPKPADRFPTMDLLLRELRHDPRRRRQQWMLGAAAAGALLVSVAGLLQHRHHRGQLCTGGGERFASVWNTDRAQVLAGAFGATGAPFAGDAWRSVSEIMDAYRGRWVEAYTTVCERTRIRGEQSEELLDRQMACLGQRLHEADTLLGLLAAADAEQLAEASEAVLGLRSVTPCTDTTAMTTELPPPDDPAIKDRIAALRDLEAEARATKLAGDWQGALARLEASSSEAEAVGYPPLEASLLTLAANIEIELGEADDAEQDLHRALVAAERGGADAVAANVATELVWLHGYMRTDFEQAERWYRLAEAKLARVQGAPELRTELLFAFAAALQEAGRYDEALRMQQEHFDRALAEDGEGSLGAAHAHQHLANALSLLGRHGEAMDHYRRALELRERHLGPNHPEVASTLTVLAYAWDNVERYDEALAAAERALAIQERVFGPDHANLAPTLNNLGYSLDGLGRSDEALEVYARAVAVARAAYGPEHPQVAHPHLNRAHIYFQRGQHRAALEDARAAYHIYATSLGDEHPYVASAGGLIGQILLASGRADEAVRHLERALLIRQSEASDPLLLARTEYFLAQALVAEGHDRARARSLALQARDRLRTAGEHAATDLAEVEGFIDETWVGSNVGTLALPSRTTSQPEGRAAGTFEPSNPRTSQSFDPGEPRASL